MADRERLYQERDKYLRKVEEIRRRGGTTKAIAEVKAEAEKRQREVNKLELPDA